ncbi:unnamed protein product [Amoebophrya sp. A120]|nr:unnamed protein product [Amoebophrya sp. A120]|eukprot:GSA120T00005996001.1
MDFAMISANAGKNAGSRKIFDALQIGGGHFTKTEFELRDLDGSGEIDSQELLLAVLMGDKFQTENGKAKIEDVTALLQTLEHDTGLKGLAGRSDNNGNLSPAQLKDMVGDYDIDGNGNLSPAELKVMYQMLVKEDGDGQPNPDVRIGIDSDALGIANALVGDQQKELTEPELRTYDLDDDGKMSLEELKVMYRLRNQGGEIDANDIPKTLHPPVTWDSVKSIHGDDQKLSLEEITAAVRQPAALEQGSSYHETEETTYRKLLHSVTDYGYSDISHQGGQGGSEPQADMKKIFDALQIDGGDFTEDEFNQRDLDGNGKISGTELQAAVLMGKHFQAGDGGQSGTDIQETIGNVQARMALLDSRYDSINDDVKPYDFDGKDGISPAELKIMFMMGGDQKHELDMRTMKDHDKTKDVINQLCDGQASCNIDSLAELKTYDFDADGKLSLAELKVLRELESNGGQLAPGKIQLRLLSDLFPDSSLDDNDYWKSFTGVSTNDADTNWSKEEILLAARQAPPDDYGSTQYHKLLTGPTGSSIDLAAVNDEHNDKLRQMLQIDGPASPLTAEDFNMRDLNGDGEIDSRELQVAVLMGGKFQTVEDVTALLRTTLKDDTSKLADLAASTVAVGDYDIDGDKNLSPAELKVMYQMLIDESGQTGGPDEYIDIDSPDNDDDAVLLANQLLPSPGQANTFTNDDLRLYDVNNDGKMSLEELKLMHDWHTRSYRSGMDTAAMRSRFDEKLDFSPTIQFDPNYDINNDKHFSPAELKAMRLIQTNQNSGSGTAPNSASELLVVMDQLSQESGSHTRPITDQDTTRAMSRDDFNLYDVNGDNDITLAELQAMQKFKSDPKHDDAGVLDAIRACVPDATTDAEDLKTYDLDDDGRISSAELKTLHDFHQGTADPEYDIEDPKAKAIIKGLQAADCDARAGGTTQQVSSYDINGDGKLSLAELEVASTIEFDDNGLKEANAVLPAGNTNSFASVQEMWKYDIDDDNKLSHTELKLMYKLQTGGGELDSATDAALLHDLDKDFNWQSSTIKTADGHAAHAETWSLSEIVLAARDPGDQGGAQPADAESAFQKALSGEASALTWHQVATPEGKMPSAGAGGSDMQKIFRTLDMGGDETLSRSEFLMRDLNADGKVDHEELRVAVLLGNNLQDRDDMNFLEVQQKIDHDLPDNLRNRALNYYDLDDDDKVSQWELQVVADRAGCAPAKDNAPAKDFTVGAALLAKFHEGGAIHANEKVISKAEFDTIPAGDLPENVPSDWDDFAREADGDHSGDVTTFELQQFLLRNKGSPVILPPEAMPIYRTNPGGGPNPQIPWATALALGGTATYASHHMGLFSSQQPRKPQVKRRHEDKAASFLEHQGDVAVDDPESRGSLHGDSPGVAVPPRVHVTGTGPHSVSIGDEERRKTKATKGGIMTSTTSGEKFFEQTETTGEQGSTSSGDEGFFEPESAAEHATSFQDVSQAALGAPPDQNYVMTQPREEEEEPLVAEAAESFYLSEPTPARLRGTARNRKSLVAAPPQIPADPDASIITMAGVSENEGGGSEKLATQSAVEMLELPPNEAVLSGASSGPDQDFPVDTDSTSFLAVGETEALTSSQGGAGTGAPAREQVELSQEDKLPAVGTATGLRGTTGERPDNTSRGVGSTMNGAEAASSGEDQAITSSGTTLAASFSGGGDAQQAEVAKRNLRGSPAQQVGGMAETGGYFSRADLTAFSFPVLLLLSAGSLLSLALHRWCLRRRI